jgi:hypothetical protein
MTSAGNGYYRLTTQFRGDGMCLDIFNGGEFDNMPHLAPCADFTGQYWKFRQDGGRFRLVTRFRGDAMCLDVFNGGAMNNMLHLAPCANFSGQFWMKIPPTG